VVDKFNDNKAKVCSAPGVVNPDQRADERTRRDAIARSLAARVCSELRTDDELRRLDRMLSVIEQADDILAELDAHRYPLAEARDANDRAYRRGWNDALTDAGRVIRAATGQAPPPPVVPTDRRVLDALRELADNAPEPGSFDHLFDLGGEGG
jgi:hypothetical protein